MADSNQKFAPKPSNIVIRTMKKDLEALRQGGGTISQLPPEEPQTPVIPEENFLYQNVPQPSQPSAPLPPTLEGIPSQEAPQPAQPPITPTPTKPEMPEKKALPPALLFGAGGAVFVFVLGAIGYFVILPQLRPEPTLTPPVVTLPSPLPPSPSPTPSPINPGITLRETFSSTTITLFDKTPSSLLVAMAQDAEKLSASGTLRTLAVLGPNDQYLTSKEFTELLLRNILPTLMSSLGTEYLPFLYYDKTAQARAGFAVRLIPQTKESVETILKTREASAIDQDFAALFLGRNPGKRKAAFKAVVTEGISFREVNYQNENLSLAYTVFNDILVVTTSREGLLLVTKNLL